MIHELCCAQADPKARDGNLYKMPGHPVLKDRPCSVEAAYGGGSCKVVECIGDSTALIHLDNNDRVFVCTPHLEEHLHGEDFWVDP